MSAMSLLSLGERRGFAVWGPETLRSLLDNGTARCLGDFLLGGRARGALSGWVGGSLCWGGGWSTCCPVLGSLNRRPASVCGVGWESGGGGWDGLFLESG